MVSPDAKISLMVSAVLTQNQETGNDQTQAPSDNLQQDAEGG